MSKKLANAINAGKIVVRSRVSGEVAISFKNPSLKPIIIRPQEDSNLTDKVPASEFNKSNLRKLISRRLLRVV